jgi:hypothetical protein
MSGTIHLRPPYAFMACRGKQVHVLLLCVLPLEDGPDGAVLMPDNQLQHGGRAKLSAVI